jgi:hypothetical protein
MGRWSPLQCPTVQISQELKLLADSRFNLSGYGCVCFDFFFLRFGHEKNVLGFTRNEELDLELETHFVVEDGDLDPHMTLEKRMSFLLN